MTYKFSRAQLECLDNILDAVIETPPEDMFDKLLLVHLFSLGKRVKIKLMDFKKAYSVVLDPATEISIYLYFKDIEYKPNSSTIILKNICDKAEKQYA